MSRLRLPAAILLGMGVSCADNNSPIAAVWQGTYAYTADSALVCVEGPISQGYPCACDAPFAYEGELTLREVSGLLDAQLHIARCRDGDSPRCGPTETLSLMQGSARVSADTVFFELGEYWSRWTHDGLVTNAGVTGRHWRRDGNPGGRGCGDDRGAFTALRR